MAIRKIIHAADIHLDSPLLRLERYEGAPVDAIRNATRRALTNLVDLAIRESVDLVVIAGDLYDGDWNDSNTGLFFVNQASRLVREGIPLVLIRGNHDAQSVMTQSLPLPKNPDGTAIMLNHQQVDKRVFEKLGVVVHGQSFATRAVTDDLSASYPAPLQGLFNLGLLHTCLTGSEGHENYAPADPRRLADRGYDYWALGHIHDRRECQQDGETPIIFSGNIQGRNIREVGAKGCLLLTLDDQHRCTTEFHALDVVRWAQTTVDASKLERLDDLYEMLVQPLPRMLDEAAGRPLALRLYVTGASKLHPQLHSRYELIVDEIRAIINNHGQGQMWFENLKLATTALRVLTASSSDDAEQAASDDALAAVDAVIDEARTDVELRADITETLKKYWTRLPRELSNHPTAPIACDDAEQINEWLDAAGPIIRSLMDSGENVR